MEFREDYAGSKFPHRFLVQISPRALARRGNRPWHGANSCQMRDASSMKKGWQLNGSDFIKTRHTCAPAKTPPFLSHEERKKKKEKKKDRRVRATPTQFSFEKLRIRSRQWRCRVPPTIPLDCFPFSKIQERRRGFVPFFFFLDRSNRLIRFPSGCSIKRIIVRWFNIAYWLLIHRRYCYIS